MALHKPDRIFFGNDLDKNLALIEKYVGEYADLLIRRLEVEGRPIAALVYFDGMTDKTAVSEFIVKPLLQRPEQLLGKTTEQIAAACLYVADWQTADNDQDFMNSIFAGDCGVLFAGSPCALITDLKGFERRGISEPQTEIVVRGSREGFIENMKTNMSMLRRRIKTPNLCFENMQLGTETNTSICLTYIRGLADPQLVQQVKDRLNSIEIDGVLESGYLEQLIEDEPFSPFPTVANSEKPDKVVAKLLEAGCNNIAIIGFIAAAVIYHNIASCIKCSGDSIPDGEVKINCIAAVVGRFFDFCICTGASHL